MYHQRVYYDNEAGAVALRDALILQGIDASLVYEGRKYGMTVHTVEWWGAEAAV